MGRGFFTAPGRTGSGTLTRKRAETFADHWSQPRLFYNSLTAVEQQFLINAVRFETSHLSEHVQVNVLAQLNKISHDIAVRVGEALGLEAPAADETYYHDNKTAGITIFGEKLPTIATLTVGVLASTKADGSISQAKALKESLAKSDVTVFIVAEILGDAVDQTYSAADATGFDGIIVTDGAEGLLDGSQKSTLYPPGRPLQILSDGYRWGKPIGLLGSASDVVGLGGTEKGPGVFTASRVSDIVEDLKRGLAVFKFTDRFPVDE